MSKHRTEGARSIGRCENGVDAWSLFWFLFCFEPFEMEKTVFLMSPQRASDEKKFERGTHCGLEQTRIEA